MDFMKKAIILGGGFAGCTWAWLLHQKKYDVTLIEKDSFLGGGCKTFFYGGHPYTLGPRPLIVRQESVYDFIAQFTPLRRFTHAASTFIAQDANFYTYFPQKGDIDRMPDASKIYAELQQRPTSHAPAANLKEHFINQIGETLYQKFAQSYNHKMWNITSTAELDSEELLNVFNNFLRDGDLNYLGMECAYPTNLNGYDDYFQKTTANATVLCNTTADTYDLENSTITIHGEKLKADLIVSTLSVDELFNFKYGVLPYAGRRYQQIMLQTEHVIPDPYYFTYYPGDEPHLRMVEYKKLTKFTSPYSLVSLEYPSSSNKSYPFPTKKAQALADKYFNDLPDNVISVGRLGIYRYIDIAQTILQATEGVKSL